MQHFKEAGFPFRQFENPADQIMDIVNAGERCLPVVLSYRQPTNMWRLSCPPPTPLEFDGAALLHELAVAGGNRDALPEAGNPRATRGAEEGQVNVDMQLATMTGGNASQETLPVVR